LHYVDHKNGVNDFDVWSFYAARDDGPFPARWRGTADFGRSKYGRRPSDPRRYQGRRVDLLGRSLPVPLEAEPGHVLRDYLSVARTVSARAWPVSRSFSSSPRTEPEKSFWPVI